MLGTATGSSGSLLVGRCGAARKAQRERSLRRQRSREHPAQLVRRARRRDGHAGNAAQIGEVEHAVMRRPVGAGDAGTIDDEGHRQAVERDVAGDLVERALQERRVDADDGTQAAHRESGCERHRVLLGDADIEEALREALREFQQPGRRCHRGGDRDDPLVGLGGLTERLAEDVGPVDALLDRGAAVRVERRDAMELVNLCPQLRDRSPAPCW